MIETIFIVGPAGAGKSAFAAELSRALEAATDQPWEAADTSAPLYRWLAEILAAGPWPSGHDSVKQWEEYIRAKKELYRPMLVKMGNVARSVNRGALLRIAVLSAGAAIVTGFRTAEEYLAGKRWLMREKSDGWKYACVYIARVGDISVRESDGFDCEFFTRAATHIVRNDGDVGALSIKAQMLAQQLVKESA